MSRYPAWQPGIGPPYSQGGAEPQAPDFRPGWSDNPDGTLPYPAPKTIGVGNWMGARTAIPWVAAPTADTIATDAILTAIWRSPIFDLRPEFRGIGGNTGSMSSGVIQGTQPIWRNGAGGKLYIQVSRLATANNSITDVVLNSIDFAAVVDPLSVEQVTMASDITGLITGPGMNGAILIAEPPGEGQPVRFWQIRLVFDRMSNIANTFDIQAGYY